MQGSVRRTDWNDDRIPRPRDIRVARLRQAVTQLLAAARRGESTPEILELVVLHSICAERGLFDCTQAIRNYIAQATHVVHSSRMVQ